MVPAEVTFTEQWFSTASCEALADLYSTVAHLDGLIVEVGSWEGRSTVALANACVPATVHAVDTWQGSPGEISADLAAGRDVYRTFCDNVYELTAGNVATHRMGWREWFATNTEPIRMLFIDAEHTYREVFDNIQAATPFVVPDGVICGDDAHHPPVQQAVLDTLGNCGLAASLWHWRKEER